MLRVWQKRLLNNRESVQYDFSVYGEHSVTLKAGTYDIWLVGGGGGAAMLYNTSNGVKYFGKGGVGGVICARVNVPRDTTVTVNVGSGGASRQGRTSETSSVSGNNAQNSSITGIPNLTLVAGGGTAASVTVGNPIAGIQGTNTANGSNLIRVIENNVNTIVSLAGQSSATQYVAAYVDNTNWPEDMSKGSGGTIGWTSNSSFITRVGKIGFVRIKSAN